MDITPAMQMRIRGFNTQGTARCKVLEPRRYADTLVSRESNTTCANTAFVTQLGQKDVVRRMPEQSPPRTNFLGRVVESVSAYEGELSPEDRTTLDYQTLRA